MQIYKSPQLTFFSFHIQLTILPLRTSRANTMNSKQATASKSQNSTCEPRFGATLQPPSLVLFPSTKTCITVYSQFINRITSHSLSPPLTHSSSIHYARLSQSVSLPRCLSVSHTYTTRFFFRCSQKQGQLGILNRDCQLEQEDKRE